MKILKLLLLATLSLSNSCTSQTGDSVKILFKKSTQTLGDTRTFGVAIADIDLDGDNDIFIPNYIGQSILWLNNGNGTFVQSKQSFNLQEVHDVAITDFNGDKYPDIFLISHASPNRVFFNKGDGSFTESEQNLRIKDEHPQFINLGDVDMDGDTDIFIYNIDGPNRLWLNNGNGIFAMVDEDYGGDDAKGFELADFNGDSFPDLFVQMRQKPNRILMNDGSGKFKESGIDVGTGGDKTGCVDFDKDGDIDIVITDNTGVTIWQNQDNTGKFIPSKVIEEAVLKCKFLDADMDNDLDIITISRDNVNKLWINKGFGKFELRSQIFGNNRTLCIRCDDFDGDGDLDIVFGQKEGTGGNAIYLNESVSDN
ncbi:MAG: VCBS repeat-containing protein [ANME-2 cluster archaeon]|nr:MAG: VCBS repeat-containing protein [ANME-2 cluster archaeon]